MLNVKKRILDSCFNLQNNVEEFIKLLVSVKPKILVWHIAGTKDANTVKAHV